METRVVSRSTLRRRARRDLDRTLQQISDDYNTNMSLTVDDQSEESVLGDICNKDAGGEDTASAIDMDTSVYEDIDGSIHEQMDKNISDFPQCSRPDQDPDSDLSESDDVFKPSSLRESICNWALTFGISLVALTALLGILQFYHPDLPKDARTILKTDTRYTIQNKVGGQYHYFGIFSSIKRTLSQIIASVTDGFTLKLQINIDGLPLFKSSGVQIWPILGLLVSVPMKEPVVIALFCGMNKPSSANEFLKDFIVELQELEKGFDFNGKQLFLKVNSVICDAPARAFVKRTKPHNDIMAVTNVSSEDSM